MGLESSFGNNAKLFRNFIVDFANHPAHQRTVEFKGMSAQTTLMKFTREKIEAFCRYLEESRLKWEDYRTLAPSDFQNTQQFEVKVKPLDPESLEKAEIALKNSNQTHQFWERRWIEEHSLEWLRERQRCFELYQSILR